MKKKTAKKAVALIVLLFILGGLITGFVLLKKFNAEEEAPEEETAVTVFDKGKYIVTNLSFVSEEQSMSFSFINDDWKYDKDNNFPLNQDRVAAMASAIGVIEATVTVSEVSKNLSDYGLDNPALTVDAVFSDSSEKTFTFGDINSFNNCQYLMISGDDNVYMVEESVSTAFAVDLDYLYEPESYTLQKNNVTAEDVISITVTTAAGQSKEITDIEGIEKLYELVYTLDLSDYEDYYADKDEMLESYGISTEGDRVHLKYTVESENGEDEPVTKEYCIYFGHKFEDAEDDETESTDTTAAEEKNYFYFYSFDGSTVVYSADGETVDDIFEYLAYEAPAELETAE